MSEEIISESAASGFSAKEKFKGAPEANEQNIIGSSSATRKGGTKKGSVTQTANGAIGSKKADAVSAKDTASKAKEKQDRKATIALYSTKNVSWPGVGEVKTGYNIVSEADAARWLTRSHIRVATPEEVAAEFGV